MDNRSPIGRHCPLSGDDVLSAKGQRPKAKRQWPRPKVKGQEAKSKEPKAKS